MLIDRIEADYLLETPIDPRRAAEIMAGEQSSGTFVAVPGETPEMKERSAARVTALERLEGSAARRSLPSAGGDGEGERLARAQVTLSWPLATIGPSLPNLVATVAGNLFELKTVSGLRLSTSGCRRPSPTPIPARASASRARAASRACRAVR
jgi:ribulose-bisphosphate carboxylase large chain